MSEAMHPLAPHHLPGFITPPGETDVLFVGSVIALIIIVLMIGSLYFWLHALPERMAHGASNLQFQLVGVLSLLALFTHNNAFWVAALLLAFIPIPDFWTPLANMAESLARMASRRSHASDASSRPAAEGTAISSPALAGHPQSQEAATDVTARRGSETPSPAPSIGPDSRAPAAGTQGQSLPESASDSRHRVLPAEGREP